MMADQPTRLIGTFGPYFLSSDGRRRTCWPKPGNMMRVDELMPDGTVRTETLKGGRLPDQPWGDDVLDPAQTTERVFYELLKAGALCHPKKDPASR